MSWFGWHVTKVRSLSLFRFMASVACNASLHVSLILPLVRIHIPVRGLISEGLASVVPQTASVQFFLVWLNNISHYTALVKPTLHFV